MTTPKSVHSTSWLGQWMVSCVSGLLFFFFNYLFLAMPALHCSEGFSLVGASGGSSLVVVCRLLIVVASLLWSTVLGTQASAVAPQVDSVAVAPGL